mmetsp:Transcript_21333/g.49027  ORF Transcript_21333/g.49027 Transcript_21333/m.49027 type:complete len:218 (-) Transcript_21333:191-844(-)
MCSPLRRRGCCTFSLTALWSILTTSVPAVQKRQISFTTGCTARSALSASQSTRLAVSTRSAAPGSSSAIRRLPRGMSGCVRRPSSRSTTPCAIFTTGPRRRTVAASTKNRSSAQRGRCSARISARTSIPHAPIGPSMANARPTRGSWSEAALRHAANAASLRRLCRCRCGSARLASSEREHPLRAVETEVAVWRQQRNLRLLGKAREQGATARGIDI